MEWKNYVGPVIITLLTGVMMFYGNDLAAKIISWFGLILTIFMLVYALEKKQKG